MFVLASVTDWLDGYLARNVYGVTTFGKLMDPLADKVLVTAAYVAFVEIHTKFWLPDLPLVPAFVVVLVLSREFMVTGLRLIAAGKGQVISAGKWGKHKTVWQIAAITVTLLGLAILRDILPLTAPNRLESTEFIFRILVWTLHGIAALITIASGIKYFVDHRDIFSRHA
jgi:CDP-diacylglycerol--glycerol-3-phosphate 3-phosphatidyltransferase